MVGSTTRNRTRRNPGDRGRRRRLQGLGLAPADHFKLGRDPLVWRLSWGSPLSPSALPPRDPNRPAKLIANIAKGPGQPSFSGPLLSPDHEAVTLFCQDLQRLRSPLRLDSRPSHDARLVKGIESGKPVNRCVWIGHPSGAHRSRKDGRPNRLNPPDRGQASSAGDFCIAGHDQRPRRLRISTAASRAMTRPASRPAMASGDTPTP